MSKKWQTFKKSVQQISPFLSPYKWEFIIAIFMIVVTCFASVSYTHLDVYKRQALKLL